MKLKRRNALMTFGVGGVLLWVLLIWCVPQSEGTIAMGNHERLKPSWIGLSGLMITFLAGIPGRLSETSNVPLTIVYANSQIPLKNATTNVSGINSTISSNGSIPEVGSSHQPRRLNKLPLSHSSSNRRSSSNSVPESAKFRARTLLGSLNRQNCFARVLCGLGARPPSTKTDLVNDYVYLMEELLVDDDDENPDTDSIKNWGKLKGKKNKKNKVFTKKDDSDSSQSEESKEEKVEKTKEPEFGWLADEELVGEDPAVLRYVKLEQKRRKLKTGGAFSKRTSRVGAQANTTDAPMLQAVSENEKNITVRSRQQSLDVKKTRKVIRQMEKAVKGGRSFGSARQCRTVFNRCPFDDKQMNEIITNMKKMMQGQTQTLSKTPNRVPGVSNGGVKTVVSNGQSSSGQGSKVEIVLHLNQNGMPYAGGYPMAYPATLTSSQPGITVPVQQSHYPGFMPQPQQQQQPPYMPMTISEPAAPSPPPPPTSTTAPETTTTIRSPGEEQLLDFLYGVVNFNDTEKESSLKPIERNPNPFWALTNSPTKDSDFFDTIEKPLKVKKRKPPPTWALNDADDDDDSKSSEEVELKQYLLSLKETLEGLAQMNNATLAVEQKVVKSSEEEDSPEDILDDGGFPLPGVQETDEEDEEEDDNEPTADKEVKLKVKDKKKVSNPASDSQGSSTTPRPPKNPSDSDALFDDDNEDNGESQTNWKQAPSTQPVKSRPPYRKRPQKPEDDDEYEPEESGENDDDNDEQSDIDQDQNSGDTNDEQNDDENDESEEIVTKNDDKRKDAPRQKITLKFEAAEPGKDSSEMSDQEKRKLAALSDAIMPTPSGIARPHKKYKPDVIEEIRLPYIKPVLKEFQSVGNLAKNTAVINIDEFAEDSGITPVFPKKNSNRPHRPYKRYQNKRRPPAVRPYVRQEDESKSKPVSSEEEDEEDDDKEDDQSGPSVRTESMEITPIPIIPHTSSQNPAKAPYKTKPKSKAETNKNRKRHQFPSPPTPQDFSGSNGPLIAVPYEPAYPSPPSQQQQPLNGNYDFLSGVFNMMGLRPASDADEGQPPPPNPGYYPMGYYGPTNEDMSHVRPYVMDFGPGGESNRGRHSNKDYRGKSDISVSVEDKRRPQPKIHISIPFDEFVGGRQDGDYQDDKGDKKKDGDKKEEGGDKKKEGGDKEKGKQKEKKNKKKKGDKDGGGEEGYSTQFHQQVYPAPEKETGIWSKIKGYIDKLGTVGTSETGETPFIQVGFSDSNPVADSHEATGTHGHYGGPGHKPGPGHGPVFQQNFGSDEHSEEEEEEDEEEEEEDDIGFSEEFDDHNAKETENKVQTNVTTHAESNSDEQVVPVPPSPTSTLIATTVDPKLVLPLFPALKSTLAPKPPKYKVNQNRIKNKKRRQGDRGTTTGQPISLFTTTTEPPPTTWPTTLLPQNFRPPKRTIVYKSGGKRVLNRPGSAIQYVTTLKTTTVKPVEVDKESGEDDEIEPLSVFFQPGPKGQNVRGRPPIPIDAFHIQSEDMLIDSSEQRRRSDAPFFNRRPKPPMPGSPPRHGPPPPRSGDEKQSAMTTAVMNSPIFSNHFKHLYTRFQSFGQYFKPTMRNDGYGY